jgi:murein DD-endopeptidase MepM/ murein hydrolase activator NlpD
MKLKHTALVVLTFAFLSGLFAMTASGHGNIEKKLLGADRTAKKLGLGTRLSATLMLNGGFPKSWARAAGGDTPPRFLQWPMPGHRLGRGFGSNDGKHLAIDVSADIGTPVHAMAPGIVGYADDGVRGYGNMVMLVHPGGWVTLYAHLSRFKVAPGQRIARDQVIALSGNTGISRGPHLHFALIIQGKPVDPMHYMRGAPGQKPLISRLFQFPFPLGPAAVRG